MAADPGGGMYFPRASVSPCVNMGNYMCVPDVKSSSFMIEV